MAECAACGISEGPEPAIKCAECRAVLCYDCSRCDPRDPEVIVCAVCKARIAAKNNIGGEQ